MVRTFVLACILPCIASTNLSDKIQSTVDKLIPNTNIGVDVRTIDGKSIARINSEQFFLPASTAKLFTAMAATSILPLDHRFHTEIAYEQDNSTAHNAVFITSGDPTFSTNDLYRMVEKLKGRGVTKIAGDFLIADSAYAGPAYGPGWVIDSQHWYYSAPISSIMLNQNSVKLKIGKHERMGQKIPLGFMDSRDSFLTLNTDVKTVSRKQYDHECQLEANVTHTNDLHLTGCWPKSSGRQNFSLAIQDPLHYFKGHLKRALNANNIYLEGDVKLGRAQVGPATRTIAHDSARLPFMLEKVLSHSDNIVSEALYKTIGRESSSDGSYNGGRLALSSALKQIDAEFGELNLYDGSGLSRYSLLKPSQLSTLLAHIWRRDDLRDVFLKAFATPGHGRLVGRLKGLPVFGKTGSMLGSNLLTGYILWNENRPVIFTVMLDRGPYTYEELRRALDSITRTIAEEVKQQS